MNDNVAQTAAAASWQIATTFAMLGIALLQLTVSGMTCLVVTAVAVDLYQGWPGLLSRIIAALP